MLLNIKQKFMILVFCIVSMTVHAHVTADQYYRSFWTPVLQGQRLDYCTSGARVCGLPLADRFCKIMGYESAAQAKIDYNVGFTRHLDNASICKGWSCHGWRMIQCKSQFKPQGNNILKQVFYYPRMHWARVDYCYMQGHGCGKRAAYAFCRSMSYEHVSSFKKQAHVLSTCTLGEQQRCFGSRCNGFAHITCTR